MARAREEHAQVVVDFGGGADGAPRVAGVDLLLHGDSRRQTLDVVAFGLGHSAEKLAGVCREALDISALPLGVKSVEGEARLARAADPRHDHQPAERQLEVYILEIVDSRALDADEALRTPGVMLNVLLFFHHNIKRRRKQF